MKIRTGLNPYGLTYVLGLQGRGTPRAYARASGLEGFIGLGQEIGAKTLEIWEGWLLEMSDAELAARFGAAALLGRWSRLLIDLNRGPDDPTLVMKLSDGSLIPGNRHADAAEIERRLRLFHEPYHQAITAELDRIGPRASIISIHSFTPSWKGVARPWEVGVLWDRDRRLAGPLMAGLSQHAFTWGDNEPYSGALENDCLNRHGTKRGLPHVLVEVRQDLIADEKPAQAFAERLFFVLQAALGDMERIR